jgi:hypothetical protein
MVVPEAPNERPEVPNQQGAEAQAVNKAQQDVRSNPVSSNDLNSVFSGRDDSSALLGDLTFNSNDANSAMGDVSTANPVVNEALKDGSNMTNPIVREALNTYREIAKVTTTEELEKSLSMQKNTVVAMENQVNGATNGMQLADDKQQADNLLNANTYLANFA